MVKAQLEWSKLKQNSIVIRRNTINANIEKYVWILTIAKKELR